MNNCIYFYCNYGSHLPIRARVPLTCTLENSVIPIHAAKSILWHHISDNENLQGCLWKPLQKHVFSNILKISPPKTESFQIQILIFFIFVF